MASRKSIPSVGKLTQGRPSLADDCEAILKSIGDIGENLPNISSETGLPTARIADLLAGPLADQVHAKTEWIRGIRITIYRRKGG